MAKEIDLICQFCGEAGFDLLGMVAHLSEQSCGQFKKVYQELKEYEESLRIAHEKRERGNGETEKDKA